MGEIIFDTDIGTDVDDAYCLAVLAGLDEPRLSAVSTVYGDVGLRAQITLKLLEIMGRADVAVYAGARRPLLSERETFWGGHEGRDFVEGDEYAAAVDPQPAACFLAERVMSAAEPVTLVVTGPVTNLALAAALAPEMAGRVERLYFMGGCLDAHAESLLVGSTRLPPSSEHNLNCDPEAALMFFRAGFPITITPRETTDTVPFTRDFLGRLRALGTPLADALWTMTEHWLKAVKNIYLRRGIPAEDLPYATAWLHDPLALMPLCAPHMVRTETRRMAAEIIDGVPRTLPRDNGPVEVEVVTGVDRPAFYDYLIECIARYR